MTWTGSNNEITRKLHFVKLYDSDISKNIDGIELFYEKLETVVYIVPIHKNSF